MSGLRLGIVALASLLLLQLAAAVLLREERVVTAPGVTAARVDRVVRLLETAPRRDHGALVRGAGAGGLAATVAAAPAPCVAAPGPIERRTITAIERRLPGRAICAVSERRAQVPISGGDVLLVALPPPQRLPLPRGALVALTAAAIAVVALALVARDAIAIRQLSRGMEAFRADVSEPLRPSGSPELRHLTDRFNRLQSRIAELTRDRTAHWSGVSHDIGTLLTRIALRIDSHGDNELRDRIDGDMAALRRILANGREWARSPGIAASVAFDPLPIIADVLATFDGVATSALPPSPIPMAIGDPSAFERVLINLVDNADRHAGGAHVTVRAAGERVIVSVDDRGSGLTDAQRATFAKGSHANCRDQLSGLSVAARLAGSAGMTLTSVAGAKGHSIVIELASPIAGEWSDPT